MHLFKSILFFFAFGFIACTVKTEDQSSNQETIKTTTQEVKELTFDQETNTIHIIVALCDNIYQGIVPVPESLGNGQDTKNNLYWGSRYGIKNYFNLSQEWTLIDAHEKDSVILERLVFKHNFKSYYVVADAYNGRFIKTATEHFLASSAGITKEVLKADGKKIGINGNARMLAYIGHDGLMDFSLDEEYKNQDGIQRDVAVLACFSKHYFEPHLEKANVNPLLWTTGLMAPEAYTIHDAISGYVLNASNEAIRLKAAQAYSKYQNCSLTAAKNLLVTD